MRALGYFRTEDGPDRRGELEQAFLDYCHIHLHQPVKTFGDTALAEDGPLPEYDRLVRYMGESRGSFLVVVPDAEHLGGDLESVVRRLVELESAGAKVICEDDDHPDPLQGALRSLGVKGVSRERSRLIRESMHARALDGRGLGRPPYGYGIGATGTLEVVPEEAWIVQLVYSLYTIEGLGLRLIAQRLNARGFLTRRGGKWSVATIRDILRNSVYMGTYTRYGLRLPKSHGAIVSPEVFRAAQDATRARRPVRRRRNREPFLLSGLVYCAYCGNRMMGVTRRQMWKRKDGRRARGVYRYYQCQSRNNLSLCDYHTWRASRLEDTVLAELRRQSDAGHSRRHRRHDIADPAAVRETAVRNAARRFLRAVRRAARGELTLQALGKQVTDLDAARTPAADAGRPADVAESLASWESLDMPARQSFLADQIARVMVRDDAVRVVT